MFFILFLISIATQLSTILATSGIDVSESISSSAFQCLKNNGYEFAIVRVYQSIGEIDPNGAQSIENAKNAGIQYVDGYLYPCVHCGNPDQQVLKTVNHLKQEGADFGMIWLVVAGDWTSNTSANIQFLLGLINQANIMSVSWGIFTSKDSWNTIMGGTQVFGQPALWYSNFDNDPSFSDFEAFGGWQKPSIKQFSADANECGVGINKNFY